MLAVADLIHADNFVTKATVHCDLDHSGDFSCLLFRRVSSYRGKKLTRIKSSLYKNSNNLAHVDSYRLTYNE